MPFKLIRLDSKKDDRTSLIFENYDDAYEFLKKFYGEICCSDINFEDEVDYNIIEIN